MAAAGIVALALVVSGLAGPRVAGAVAAFPTMCLVLTVAVIREQDRRAAAAVLTGMVHSLPSYLVFCVTVGLTVAVIGVPSIPIGVLACVGIAVVTWRRLATRKHVGGELA